MPRLVRIGRKIYRLVILVMSGFVLGSMHVSASGQSAETYYVFEIAAPSELGPYRLRPSDDMVRMWDSEKLQALRVFDAAGDPLLCESVRSLALADVRNTYVLHGKWLDDEAAWKLPPEDRFEFNSIWRFDLQKSAENEFPSALRFTWHSTLNNPGDVQLVLGVREGRIGPWLRTSLLDGQWNVTDGHVYLYVAQRYPQTTWLSSAELRFSIVADELTLDPPTLETATRRPWVHQVTWDRPGWYIFHGNGKTPYRVQIGRNFQGCTTLAAEDRDLNVEDPNWPAEATISRQISNSPRLGKQLRIR